LYKKIIGTYYALWPIGAATGSIIGGYLAVVSLSFPILMTFIPLLIASILTFFLKEPPYEKEGHHNVFKHIKNSAKIVINNKQLMILMIGGFILIGFGEAIHLLDQLFFKFKEIPLEFFGWITASTFALSSLGHYLSNSISEKLGNKRTLILSVLLSPLILIIATFSLKYFAIVLFIITSIFFGIRNPITSHLINQEVESKKRATVLSSANLISQFGLAILAPMIGYFAEIYSINQAFKLSAILLLSVPILYLFLKDKN